MLPSPTRRALLTAAASLAAASLAPAAARAQDAAAGKVTLAGWSKPISEITNLLAEPDKGFFKAQGVELVYLPGAGGGDAIRNILSGQADVAFTDPGSFFMALDKGEKLRAIYDIYPQNVFNVVSLKSANITRPADLKGKRIGVYSLASGTRQNLLVMLHQAGLTEADVEIVVTGVLNFAPLLQGQVDATAATDTGLLVGRRRGLGEVNVMEVRDTLNVSSDLFVARESVLQQKLPLLRAFLKAYRDSAAWMIAQPEEAATLAGKRAIDGTDRAINLEVIRLRNAASIASGGRPLGTLDLDLLQKAADAYRELGLIQNRIDVAAAVDTSLLPAA
ncbi:nitrate ABC transporter substrate-binding protein [Achromobacter marplatensis]|uniref:Thiamine pyrimidine synthase n=1 Tax=Achromobacter marplatensis TaxID=470868 RepID=A0ABX9GAH4_9BURK|nr:ABC transporter substrate-binding protein [Achromobacter marplatensis]OWT68763.1 nitrate ABC transporter substrate-binding protein [Achromobacter marplatensis]RBP20775.1 NitT/TauT family transport system substrate-binding protein [Achromobacter marplatensis]CAB3679328.1 Riboflavin-binding protein RibY [Achromobacter marplatensis]